MADRRIALALCAAALLAGLSACARPTGDFGRAQDSLLHDETMPALGNLRARSAKEPVSDFVLADQEIEMRDRIWRYLVAPHAKDWFYDTVAELERTRLRPTGKFDFKTDRYYQWLTGERFASSRVRYSRITDDIAADIGTAPSTFRAICAVQRMDEQRAIAGGNLDSSEAGMRQEAEDRQAENEMVIGWFVRSIGYRYDSYSYALDHLLVETPHEEAIEVDAGLSGLAIYVEAAERGDFCSGDVGGGGSEGDGAIRSRYVQKIESEGDYRK
ncbi:MAG: hypothetical protein ABIO40_02665 [Devosia sp.]